MILQLILKYRNGSNFAHTFLSTIKSSGANPSENFFNNHVNVRDCALNDLGKNVSKFVIFFTESFH